MDVNGPEAVVVHPATVTAKRENARVNRNSGVVHPSRAAVHVDRPVQVANARDRGAFELNGVHR